MNRITKTQLASLLLIGDAFTLFCLSGGISVMTAAGFAAGSILQLFIALPLIRFYEKGRNLADCGALTRTALLIYMFAWGGMLFSMLWRTGDVIYIPYENTGAWGRLVIAGLIAAVCVYISSSGIKALARSGVIAAALGAVCLGIVIVSAAVQSDIRNLLLPQERNFFAELIKGFGISGGLGSFVVLLSFTEGDMYDSAAVYFTGKTVLSAAVVLTAVLVTGGIMSITELPVASAAQLSQPFPVQRIDSLFLIAFSVFAVYSLAVQAAAAEYLIGRTFPAVKKFRCALSLAIMAVFGFVLGGRQYESVFAAASAAVLLFPAAEIFLKGRRRKVREA